MRRRSARLRITAVGAGAALAALLSVGSASADTTPQLAGDWAPFSRCPVDDPAMLAADGSSDVAQCISSHSTSGTMKLGNTTVPTGNADLQIGIISHNSGAPATLVAPSGGALVADSADIPGGLLGLMCPSKVPVISSICDGITNSTLNRVTATMVSAGAPTNFSLPAGIGTGQPMMTIPVKIKLSNPFLASTCTIGTDSNPILLKPGNDSAPSLAAQGFDGNGTPDSTIGSAMTRIAITGADQSDSTFAVPGASNCGLLGAIDLAVDLKTGIPASSGTNKVVLNSASTYLGGLTAPGVAAPNDGSTLSQYWHSAVQ
ncbi:hypothetical protein BIV57_18460 [Mangrovactinospora gilvigrisea]|uniref:Secreted protein n=1 Tax=Mangrovactinospora gilvigrisea TaxID=1428644 RepID=A0A1J7C398_9ACTN|nr:hypothetical protein [Mangrovactinospora gilvigrisea]OIV36036.1 hypothetical protein BIV57_18460 [Mangrovactinospora gilvigrisea]